MPGRRGRGGRRRRSVSRSVSRSRSRGPRATARFEAPSFAGAPANNYFPQSSVAHPSNVGTANRSRRLASHSRSRSRSLGRRSSRYRRTRASQRSGALSHSQTHNESSPASMAAMGGAYYAPTGGGAPAYLHPAVMAAAHAQAGMYGRHSGRRPQGGDRLMPDPRRTRRSGRRGHGGGGGGFRRGGHSSIGFGVGGMPLSGGRAPYDLMEMPIAAMLPPNAIHPSMYYAAAAGRYEDGGYMPPFDGRMPAANVYGGVGAAAVGGGHGHGHHYAVGTGPRGRRRSGSLSVGPAEGRRRRRGGRGRNVRRSERHFESRDFSKPRLSEAVRMRLVERYGRNTIFVRNLPHWKSKEQVDDDLKEHFAKYGRLIYVSSIPEDRRHCKGVAYVTMSNESEVRLALNGKVLDIEGKIAHFISLDTGQQNLTADRAAQGSSVAGGRHVAASRRMPRPRFGAPKYNSPPPSGASHGRSKTHSRSPAPRRGALQDAGDGGAVDSGRRSAREREEKRERERERDRRRRRRNNRTPSPDRSPTPERCKHRKSAKESRELMKATTSGSSGVSKSKSGSNRKSTSRSRSRSRSYSWSRSKGSPSRSASRSGTKSRSGSRSKSKSKSKKCGSEKRMRSTSGSRASGSRTRSRTRTRSRSSSSRKSGSRRQYRSRSGPRQSRSLSSAHSSKSASRSRSRGAAVRRKEVGVLKVSNSAEDELKSSSASSKGLCKSQSRFGSEKPTGKSRYVR